MQKIYFRFKKCIKGLGVSKLNYAKFGLIKKEFGLSNL